jgi:hypothetical protein
MPQNTRDGIGQTESWLHRANLIIRYLMCPQRPSQQKSHHRGLNARNAASHLPINWSAVERMRESGPRRLLV